MHVNRSHWVCVSRRSQWPESGMSCVCGHLHLHMQRSAWTGVFMCVCAHVCMAKETLCVPRVQVKEGMCVLGVGECLLNFAKICTGEHEECIKKFKFNFFARAEK